MSFNYQRESLSKHISQESSKSIFNSPFGKNKKSNHKNNSKKELEQKYNKISIIIDKFKNEYHDGQQIAIFKENYRDKLDGGYLELVLILKEFRDFNLSSFLAVTPKINDKKESKGILQIKNNIILTIIITAHKTHSVNIEDIKQETYYNQTNSSPPLPTFPFLDSIINDMKSEICEYQYKSGCNFEIEVFFLSLFNYTDIALTITQKQSDYFRRFLKKLKLPDRYTMKDLIEFTAQKSEYKDYTINEIIVLRKIFSKIAKRKFYAGLEFLLTYKSFNIIISEGKIWKGIGENFTHEQVFNLWKFYEEKIDTVLQADLKKTIVDQESKDKIQKLIHDIICLTGQKDTIMNRKKELDHKKKEIEKENNLGHVISLDGLLEIFFQYHLKELIMYFFDQFKQKNIKITQKIYELCLSYDEDISCNIMDRAVNQVNASEDYMKKALLNKYLRLAKGLMKYSVCKAFLNTPAPKNCEYEQMMHENQYKKKNEDYAKVFFNKTDKNEGEKMINFFNDNGKSSSLQSLRNNNITHNNNSISIQELLPNEHGTKNPQLLKLKENSGSNLTNIEDNGGNISERKKDNQCKSKENAKANSYKVAFDKLSPKKKNHVTARFEKGMSVIIKEPPVLNAESELNILNKITITNNLDLINKNNSIKNIDKSKTTLMFKSNHHNLKQEIKPAINNVESGCQKSVNYISESSKSEQKQKPKNIEKLPQPDVQSILINELRYGNTAFNALCLLLSINDHSINLDLAEKTCKNLLVFTTSEDAISKCTFPLITIALAAEYLTKIGHLSQKIQYKTLSVVEELLKLGESIQSSMKDEDNLNYFLKEQIDHIGRNALEIYAENNFSILLNDMSVGDIVGKMWYGTGYELSIFRFFRLTRILTCNIVYEKYISVVGKDYLPKDSVYSFQFNHYIRNCSLRFSVSGIMIIFSTLLYQAVIFFYVEETRTVGNPFDNKSFYLFTFLVNMKAVLNLLNSLLFFIYYYKTGRRPRISVFDLIIDIILLIAIIINFFDLPEIICNYNDYQECNLLLNGILYSIIITTSWMRVIAILLKTLAYGSFFRIMFQIVWHVMIFLLITFCLDFCFAQVFTIFFKKSNQSFQEIFYGFITLFNTAFGQVQFENFTQLTIYGYICLIAYTTVSNIMLFNLIVGIIDNLFDSLGERADAENRSLLILAHERIKWDDRYGLLILLPSPFNAFSLIFIIILLIASKINEDIVTQLNMFFSKICYFFIALSYFIFLIILGLICIPFAFIKSIGHSCYDLFTNFDYESQQTITHILQLIIFRLPDLIGFFVDDLYLFWKLVYKETKDTQDSSNKNGITKEYIELLRNVLRHSKFREKKKILTMDELFIVLNIKPKRRKTQYFSDNSMKSPSNVLSGKTSVDSLISNNSHKDQKDIINKENLMKNLIEKLIDTDALIDIERTLFILPPRVRYDDAFFKNLNHINIRVLLRGLRKYFFGNDVTNSIYSYKKMQNLINKLFIKFHLIYHYLPKDKAFENIKGKFNSINLEQRYQKTSRAFGEYEEKEDISEYDDAGDFCFNLSEIGQGNGTE